MKKLLFVVVLALLWWGFFFGGGWYTPKLIGSEIPIEESEFVTGPPALVPVAEMPPVQVEILTATRAWSYDCWPIGRKQDVQPEPNIGGMSMTVYLTYPSGIAGYACQLVGKSKVWPILPPIVYQKINVAWLVDKNKKGV